MYFDTTWMIRILPGVVAAVAGCGCWDDLHAPPSGAVTESAEADPIAHEAAVSQASSTALDWLRPSDGDNPRFTVG